MNVITFDYQVLTSINNKKNYQTLTRFSSSFSIFRFFRASWAILYNLTRRTKRTIRITLAPPPWKLILGVCERKKERERER
jgi:hypothetical protein